jgi:subtilisin family serine protease
MRSARALVTAAAVALAVVAPATALGAGFGRTLPGRESLLVTFSDHPTAAEAGARLAGIGAVRPLVAEAGVFAVDASHPATARAAALGRSHVAAAEWSLARTDEAAPPGAAPLPLLPVADPVDPLYASEWSLRPDRLWNPGLTGEDTRPRIAILDGGIDKDHEEWGGPDSPLVDPYSSYLRRVGADDWGRSGHGTHVAGIAAAPDNGIGVVGVAPAKAGSAPVIPVQIADRDGKSTDETMMDGIRWAVRHGAKVINISAGGPGFSRAFQRTVDWAFANGALIVASVGNEGDDTNVLNYPAAYAHVLGVGAICDGNVAPPDCPVAFGLARFTNHNRSLDVLAPGVDILSSVPLRVDENVVQPGYALKDGTSMAAPYVTGVAALVFATHPDASPYQVMRQIQNTATNLGPAGRDDRTGYGVVNPEAAVENVLPADDPGESNDDIPSIQKVKALNDAEGPTVINARVDRLDDAEDVVPVTLRAGDRITARLTYRRGFLNLYLWRPGTHTVATTVRGNVRRNLLAYSGVVGAKRQVISVQVRQTGRYFVNVFARRGGSVYALTIARSSVPRSTAR